MSTLNTDYMEFLTRVSEPFFKSRPNLHVIIPNYHTNIHVYKYNFTGTNHKLPTADNTVYLLFLIT